MNRAAFIRKQSLRRWAQAHNRVFAQPTVINLCNSDPVVAKEYQDWSQHNAYTAEQCLDHNSTRPYDND